MAQADAGDKHVPWELTEQKDGYATAIFSLPNEDLASALVAVGDVTARGARFAIEVDPARRNCLTTRFYSPRAEETAQAIAERLYQRLRDPTLTGNELCSVM